MSRRRKRGPPGCLRAAAWLSLILAALALVTWRQTRGVQMEGELGRIRGERLLAEAERVELVRRIEGLRSRARVVRVARERLRMHLAEPGEIVFLPIAAEPASDR